MPVLLQGVVVTMFQPMSYSGGIPFLVPGRYHDFNCAARHQSDDPFSQHIPHCIPMVGVFPVDIDVPVREPNINVLIYHMYPMQISYRIPG